MFKKIISLAIALVMMMGIAAVGFSAAEADVAPAAADEDKASVAADQDTASTSALDQSKCLNFDTTTSGWSNFEKIGFYIVEVGGPEWKPWGNKALFNSEDTGNGIWSFDPDANGVGLQAGKQYYVIFVNKASGGQTANLVFDTDCLGDIAYCDGTTQENDVDSNKSSAVARWKNHTDSSKYGPMKVITSIGNVVGEVIPANTSAYKMLVNFLASKGKDGLSNALNYKSDTPQKIIDDVAGNLGLTQADVTKAIEEAKTTGNPDTGDTNDWSDKWKASDSSLPAGDSSSGGNTGSDTTGSNSSSSSSSNSGSSSSGSSSSSKSGSASNTQTGQEENILFIMLGVMVVAAGVIFFARRKERA